MSNDSCILKEVIRSNQSMKMLVGLLIVDFRLMIEEYTVLVLINITYYEKREGKDLI